MLPPQLKRRYTIYNYDQDLAEESRREFIENQTVFQ